MLCFFRLTTFVTILCLLVTTAWAMRSIQPFSTPHFQDITQDAHQRFASPEGYIVYPWRIHAPRHLVSVAVQRDAVWELYDRDKIPEEILQRDHDIALRLVIEWRREGTLTVVLPTPMRSFEVLLYARWFELDDEQHHAWIEAFAEYQNRFLELLDERLPEIAKLAGDMVANRQNMSDEEFAEEYRRLYEGLVTPYTREAMRLEMEFIVEAVALADDADRAREIVPYVEHDRKRAAFGYRSDRFRPALSSVDLLECLILLGIDPWEVEGLHNLARSYVVEIGPVLESRFRLAPRVSQRTREIEMRNRANPPEDHAAALREKKLAREPYVRTYRLLESINREYLELFGHALDEETARELKELVRAMSFPELYPTVIDSRYDTLRAILERDDLDDEQKQVIGALLAEFEEWFERHRTEYERIVRDFRLKRYEVLLVYHTDQLVYDGQLENFNHELEDRFRRLEEEVTHYLEVTLE